jgi:hypothetical protein
MPENPNIMRQAPNADSTEAEILRVVLELRDEVLKMSLKMDAHSQDGTKIDEMGRRVLVMETKSAEATDRANSNRWLIALLSALLVGLLGIAATHISWK